MSGMKFRRTCTVCNATFFSPDRKAAYCLKCMKKRVVKHVPAEARAVAAAPRVAPRPVTPAAATAADAAQGQAGARAEGDDADRGTAPAHPGTLPGRIQQSRHADQRD